MKPSPIASILLFVGALMLLFAAFSASWFSSSFEDSSFRVGLLRGESCYGSECESIHLFQGRFRLENLIMLVTFVCTLAAAILSSIAGFLLLRPGRSVLAVLALVFAALALFGGIFFFLRIKGAGVSYGLPIFVLGTVVTIVGSAIALGRPRVGMPMHPGMVRPGMPMGPYGAPMGNPYGAPMGNPYAPPMGNPYGAPMGNPYAPPMGNPYGPPQPGANPYAPPGAAPQAPAPAAQGAPCATCSTPTTWVAQYNRWFCTRCNKYV